LEQGRVIAGAMGGAEQTVPAGGMAISKYYKTPMWNGTSPIQTGTIKFKFQFGQAGLFSGAQEVVLPILQLASLFLPKHTKGNYFTGPLPTGPAYLISFAQSLAGLITSGSIIKTLTEGAANIGKAATEAETGTSKLANASKELLTSLSDLEQQLLTAQDEAIDRALKGFPNEKGDPTVT